MGGGGGGVYLSLCLCNNIHVCLCEGPRFDSVSAFLSLQKQWFIDTVVVTLPLTVNETLNWLSSLPVLECRGHSGDDSVALVTVSLFPNLRGFKPPPPPPPQPHPASASKETLGVPFMLLLLLLFFSFFSLCFNVLHTERKRERGRVGRKGKD